METPVSFVILAAGLGTRMRSRKAKVLHRVGGLSLIEHVVRTCVRITRPQNVVAVIGHQADEVRAAAGEYGIRFALQNEQKGTGHAVMAAREAVEPSGGLVVVLYGDGPLIQESTIRTLIEREMTSNAAATLIANVMDDATGYGRVITDESGCIQAIVEQKAATPEQLAIKVANSGIYCFRGDLLWKHIDEIGTDNPAGEYYLTDMVEIFRRAGHDIGTFLVENSEELQGINTRVELARVDRAFREQKVEELMLAGVTVEKPETVTIDCDVRIGRDTLIGPFTQILGKTEIGEDCSVGACSVIQDSKIADRVQVGEFTMINDSTIAAGSRVGPYARLRLENYLEEGAAVGNFVELKKTRLGAGTKANHLAYLGDSVIGPGGNIGAGTITCNYDGVAKHQTTIGAGAFIGSNSTLVAPLEIGAGAYVGAGSVITNDVPEDALGLGRGRQTNKEDWAKRRREKRGK